jgi:hypothetical protein
VAVVWGVFALMTGGERMRKPFKLLEDLRKALEEKIRAERQVIEDADEKEQLDMGALCRAKVEAAHGYDEMVLRVLGQLRDAAFPGDEVRSTTWDPTACEEYRGHGPTTSWSLFHRAADADSVQPETGPGRWSPYHRASDWGYPRPESGHETWTRMIEVTLLFGTGATPKAFECKRLVSGREIRRGSGLSEASLVLALEKLCSQSRGARWRWFWLSRSS